MNLGRSMGKAGGSGKKKGQDLRGKLGEIFYRL